MIDTIHLFSEVDFENNKELTDQIIASFNKEPLWETDKITRENYMLGYTKNLRVELRKNSIAIKGSICKYILGNNVETLEYRLFVSGLENLQTRLGLNLKNAIVRRIDLADNLIMKEKPCFYYPLFVKGGYLKRREEDNGLYYRSTNRTILIYDKIIESKKNKELIDELYSNLNLLRYEFRMNNNAEISKRLKVENATLTDICEKYESLIYLWGRSFDLVPKDVELIISADKFLTGGTKEFINYLATHGMEHIGGYKRVMNMIHEANARKIFKYPNQATNIKQSVKRLLAKDGINKTPEMILELQTQIDEASSCASRSLLPN